MTFEGITSRGESIDLGEPSSLRLDRDCDAPADSLQASFLRSTTAVITRLRVWQEDTLIFDGLVDESESTAGENGFEQTFSARSRAALLLDNEARPQRYSRVSFPILFARHAAPLGFTQYEAPQRSFVGSFSVQKGESEWTVLENFCQQFLHTGVMMRPDGSLYAGAEPAHFWQFGDGGIAVASVSVKYKLCDLISEAQVQKMDNGSYTCAVWSKIAHALGIRRTRFFQFSQLAYRHAQDAVEEGEKNWISVTLEIPGRVDALPGDSAAFFSDNWGTFERLRVTRVVFTLENGVPWSRVVLRQEGGTENVDG